MKKLCPKCFNFVNVKKGELCPICKYDLTAKGTRKEETIKTSITPEPEKKEGISENLEALYNEANKEESQVDASVKKCDDQSKEESPKVAVDKFHQKNGRIKWVSKRVREGKIKASKFVAEPRVGGVHINVDQYTYFGKIKSKYNPSGKFVEKKDGKYEIEKLQWWEIYKWADRQLAKNKIKKAVKKEAIKKPERVSFGVLFSLCLFSGFIGVHNFYAGNIKRGLVSAICFSLAMLFVAFLNPIPFFAKYFQGLLCALPGLIAIFIWITDFISIIFRKFKYNSSRMAYIKTLDLETRARLGKKYIYIV